MNRTELIELLRSGNFTVASHDYGQISIYKGRYKGYTAKTSMPDFPKDDSKEIISFNLSDSVGYMQDVVKILTEALGGNNGGSV